MNNKFSRKIIIIIAILLLIAEFIISLFIGKYPLSLEKILFGDGQSLRVFLTLRLPRTIMSVIGGFALAVAGMVYQIVFRNQLASPDIIGVSSGASAGAAFAILFLPASGIFVTAGAFIGSLIALVTALSLARLARTKNNTSIVLAGIAVHSLAQTALMVLKLAADPEKELASIEYWIMGSLNAITLNKIPMAVVISVCGSLILVLLYRHVLMLSTDEDEAELLGVNVARMRLLILLLATLVVASVVSVTGLISFIGLLAPHIARLIMGNDRISTFLLGGIIGSILLCLSDMLARTVASAELPVSVFTSLLGAPFLIYLLMRKQEV